MNGTQENRMFEFARNANQRGGTKQRRKLRGGVNRLDEIKKSNNYGMMRIIEYNCYRNIKVKFKTGYIIKTNYDAFKKGEVKDYLFPSILGIGYIGIGKYKPSINRKMTKEYITWKGMLTRCYDSYYINKNLTYQNTTVCKEWLNFQNFAEWFNENHYELKNEKVSIDKDIIKRGNNIYCESFCSFVPQSINSLLIKCDKSRGKYPIGVSFHKTSNKYESHICIEGELKRLGYFNTPITAFNVYKKAKEKQIKIMANKYKKVLDKRIYKSLIKYKVKISD